MTEPRIYIDWKESMLSMSEMIREVKALIKSHPDEQIFMDGDLHAFVGVPRV